MRVGLVLWESGRPFFSQFYPLGHLLTIREAECTERATWAFPQGEQAGPIRN